MATNPVTSPGAQPWPQRAHGDGAGVTGLTPEGAVQAETSVARPPTESAPSVESTSRPEAALPVSAPLRSETTRNEGAATNKPGPAAPRGRRPVSEGKSIPVTAKPGGLAFTLGSGRGQFLLLIAAGIVVLIGFVLSVDAAIHSLAALAAGAGVMRLVLPAEKVPALVNRGRGFDVAVFAVCAVGLEILLLSGVDL